MRRGTGSLSHAGSCFTASSHATRSASLNASIILRSSRSVVLYDQLSCHVARFYCAGTALPTVRKMIKEYRKVIRAPLNIQQVTIVLKHEKTNWSLIGC